MVKSRVKWCLCPEGNAILFLKLERENDEEWKCKFRERIRFEIVKWNRLQMETKIEDFDHETP